MVIGFSALDDYFVLERVEHILIRECRFCGQLFVYVTRLAICCSHRVVYSLNFEGIKAVTFHVLLVHSARIDSLAPSRHLGSKDLEFKTYGSLCIDSVSSEEGYCNQL